MSINKSGRVYSVTDQSGRTVEASPVTVVNQLGSGLEESYSGAVLLGPFGGMTASEASPVILGSIRYTGDRVMKVHRIDFSPLVVTNYSVAKWITTALRKVEGYTEEDTGGTDVSGLLGARKSSSVPSVSDIQVRVAGTPGTLSSVGLTAGVRTPLNAMLRSMQYVKTADVGNSSPIVSEFREPIQLVANEGIELVLVGSSPDGSGSMSVISHIEWTMEDI